MKKLFISLLAAVSAAIATSAQAASTPTNVIDFINVQLKFTSPTATNTTYATNIIIHISGKTHSSVTNVITNIVYKSVTTAVTTSDLIGALTTNTAPAGSTLVRVRQTNDVTYLAVRHQGTNVLVLDGQLTFGNSLAVRLSPFKEKLTSTEDAITGTADELVSFSVSTPTQNLSANGEGTRTWTGDSFTIGTMVLQDVTENVTVFGSGTDSTGSDEIVIGSVTVGGDTLGN